MAVEAFATTAGCAFINRGCGRPMVAPTGCGVFVANRGYYSSVTLRVPPRPPKVRRRARVARTTSTHKGRLTAFKLLSTDGKVDKKL